ncbi:PREDICTED: odorant receptor 4-like [Eufriesea mexicana]|uniref:odorant receptor 4-like n=1 Tax=Eufriesea mexicana TaxID=516756 RepID=UPI00083C1CB3|nr:PREDICTED: odorant receptor 4-like [Eufriesea mexicana]
MADELAEVTKKFGSLSEYSIQLNRWFLKPIGAWPESSSTTRHEKILSQISIIICWCISLFTIIPALLRLILEKEDLYLKLKAFGPLSHWIVGVFNYAALLLRKDEIRRCIEHIQADWEIITRITDQRIMLKNAKIGRSIAAFTAAFVHSGIVSTCIVLGALKHTTKVGNETISIYRLPCPPYKIQTDTNPTYGIILGSQFLSGFIVTSSALGAFSVATVVTSHALGQLNVVTNWINEFVNQSDKERDSHTHKISVIVDHHLRILNLVEHIEHMMSGICFMETFKCMLGMCMPSYYMLAEWSEHNIQNLVTYALVAVSMTFNIFLVCYIGELLSEQCKKVGDIVYMTNWYQLPDKEILNLVMIISRSSMEIKITAGKLITFACSLAAVFVMHACGQFKILISKLDKLIDGKTEEKDTSTYEQRLGDIVEHHLHILSFIAQIERLLNEICFVEFVGCTMNICFLGYYLLTEWEQSETIGTVTYCALLISFIFNIFILCYIGEILFFECRSIAESAYMINWYLLPDKKALGLILMFVISNSSLKLTAGKLVELSLASFCSVLKSGLAYLSLLRTLIVE